MDAKKLSAEIKSQFDMLVRMRADYPKARTIIDNECKCEKCVASSKAFFLLSYSSICDDSRAKEVFELIQEISTN